MIKTVTANATIADVSTRVMTAGVTVTLPDPATLDQCFIYNLSNGDITVAAFGGSGGGGTPGDVVLGTPNTAVLSSTHTATPGYPAATAGDRFLLFIGQANNVNIVGETFSIGGGGWTMVDSQQVNNARLQVWARNAAASGSDSGTVNVNLSGTYAGGSFTAQIAKVGAFGTIEDLESTGGLSALMAGPVVTTTGPNRRVINVGLINTDQSGSVGAFTGMTTKGVVAAAPCLFVESASKATAGAVGGGTDGIPNSVVWIVTGFGLTPVGSSSNVIYTPRLQSVSSVVLSSGEAACFDRIDATSDFQMEQ